jgi:RHS repeat-associated protein
LEFLCLVVLLKSSLVGSNSTVRYAYDANWVSGNNAFHSDAKKLLSMEARFFTTGWVHLITQKIKKMSVPHTDYPEMKTQISNRSSKRCECVCSAFIPAATSGTGGFSAWVQAVAGNNTLTIEAEDFSPQANRRTATYRVQVNGSNRVPGYDFNGNLIDNGSGQTYEWDAENRLVKITYADQTSTEFRYDGQSRRVGIIEKDASRVVTSEKRYLWAEGAQPAEERAADGRTVVKQYHAQGEFLPGATAPLNKVFYTKDHLGSVRELVDGNGTLQTRYDYDLWGERTKLTGTMESEVGYTGHHHHGKSGLVLTWYRAYDPVTGRWLGRDPIEEEGGINLYGYVGNRPVNLVDPLGLDPRNPVPPGNRPGPGLPGGPIAPVPPSSKVPADIPSCPASSIASLPSVILDWISLLQRAQVLPTPTGLPSGPRVCPEEQVNRMINQALHPDKDFMHPVK